MADKVYLDIKRLLLSGAIPPGEKVTLRGLAQGIGTSPMPVRDAVTRLVIEGAPILEKLAGEYAGRFTLGGIRVEIGHDVIDGTVASRLDDARRKIAG